MQLAGILSAVSSDLARVEAEIGRSTAAIAASGPDGEILARIMRHPFAVPGKRIRPALVLLAGQAAGARPETAPARAAEPLIVLAAAVEILHSASLVHDDIIDGADTRRHQVSLNRRFGNRVAVLAGDILYTQFFSMITGLPGIEPARRLALLSLFIDATRAMCLGEILAQEYRSAERLRFEDYREIAADKTAALFSASCTAPAVLFGIDGGVADTLGRFGAHLGLAFQMVDDLVDGDHRLDPAIDLRGAAEAEARSARACAALLPVPVWATRLCDVVDFVIGQAAGPGGAREPQARPQTSAVRG